jgi:hypothetical protein
MPRHRKRTEAESTPVTPTLNKENKPRADTSASVGCPCTAVQSRGRGVDITEGSCTEAEYIGRGLQTATHLICCEEKEQKTTEQKLSHRCLASPE